MDVIILAGGYGTRLKGIWNKPKCLIPYKGRPLIEFLVDKALELSPRKVFLLLSHQAWEVVQWREYCCPHRDVIPIIETVPAGTASAIRNALPLMKSPLLILNGDTIPFYSLTELTKAYDVWQRTVLAWHHEQYAGAGLFHAYELSSIKNSTETSLNAFTIPTINTLKVLVSGFLDIGTPEGYDKAQTCLTWPKDYDSMEHT